MCGNASPRSGSGVFLNLVFVTYWLRTSKDAALAYTFLIVLGIAERGLSFLLDLLQPREALFWIIPLRSVLYFVIVVARYVLMIAIMGSNIPIFIVICLGLTLGQTMSELARYTIKSRTRTNRSATNENKKGGTKDDVITMPSIADEPCC